jgi:hypothetical protein
MTCPDRGSKREAKSSVASLSAPNVGPGVYPIRARVIAAAALGSPDAEETRHPRDSATLGRWSQLGTPPVDGADGHLTGSG